ncbi:unnamed protein product [Pleuronectes platessa]|uniref:Uncharacterized protein n=1 Tax=Pleuronectes platessa TaxID=8262 RepID=A0A9N7UV37_PLEPL|nr:unnamed protein product [Pleuronectes platessa]
MHTGEDKQRVIAMKERKERWVDERRRGRRGASELFVALLALAFSPPRLPNDGMTFPPRPGLQRHSQREVRTHLLAKHFTALSSPPPLPPLASDLNPASEERGSPRVVSFIQALKT